jgi:hypothetical protein
MALSAKTFSLTLKNVFKLTIAKIYFTLRISFNKANVVAHAYILSTWEAEAGLSLRPIWATGTDPVSKKKKKRQH